MTSQWIQRHHKPLLDPLPAKGETRAPNVRRLSPKSKDHPDDPPDQDRVGRNGRSRKGSGEKARWKLDLCQFWGLRVCPTYPYVWRAFLQEMISAYNFKYGMEKETHVNSPGHKTGYVSRHEI